MKHIKTYRIFESLTDGKYLSPDEIKSEVSDILQECKDIGLEVILKSPELYGYGIENNFIVEIFGAYKFDPITGDDHQLKNTPICFRDISPNIQHLISYMKSLGYNEFNYRDMRSDFNLPYRGGDSKYNVLPEDGSTIGRVFLRFVKDRLPDRSYNGSLLESKTSFPQMEDDIKDIFVDLTDINGISVEVVSELENPLFMGILTHLKVNTKGKGNIFYMGNYNPSPDMIKKILGGNFNFINIEDYISHLERYMLKCGYSIELHSDNHWYTSDEIRNLKEGSLWRSLIINAKPLPPYMKHISSLKEHNEFISEELRRVVSDSSSRGRTKSIDWIYDEEPENPKLPSAGILLRQDLRGQEFQDLMNSLAPGTPQYVIKNILQNSKNPKRVNSFIVTMNNLQFLKDKQKEIGELYCEYCNKGPLKIYDINSEISPEKIDDPNYRINPKFSKLDGATADHKTPMSKGGEKLDYSNLAVCCSDCNTKKGNMSYEDWMRAISKNEGRYNDPTDVRETLKDISIEDEKSIEIKQNLRDIGLELEDLGYNPRISRYTSAGGFKGIIKVLIYKHHHVNSIAPFLTTDVKETILRMIDYMRSENYLYYLYIPRDGKFEATEEINIEDMDSIGYPVNSLRLEFRKSLGCKVVGKTLESVSKSIDIDDVMDILLELEDEGFRTSVEREYDRSIPSSKFFADMKKNRLVKNNFKILIRKRHSTEGYPGNDCEPDFNTNEVKESVDRVFEYIRQIGVDVKTNFIVPSNARYSMLSHEFTNDMIVKYLIIVIEVKKKWWDFRK